LVIKRKAIIIGCLSVFKNENMNQLTEQQEQTISDATQLRYVDLSNPDSIKILRDAYNLLFNEKMCEDCTGEILNAYYRVQSHFKNPLVMKKTTETKSNYILKEGYILTDRENGNPYSNANLTDEIAEKLLKQNPNIIARFAKIPDSAKAETKVDTSLTQSQLDALSYVNEPERTKKELHEVCEFNDYPKSEWGRLNVDKLKAYLRSKISA
jgi:hypothetical protein